MKITLISPSNPYVCIERGRRMPQLALPLIAALTPPEFEVRIVDEDIEEVDFDEEVDLVGISMMTSQARSGYRIADEFRKRGVKVVVGGIHPSLLPEEAGEHADAVVIGEAEDIWGEVLADFKRGRLKKFYRAEKLIDLTKLPLPRRELLHTDSFFSPFPVQVSRGCPNRCSFCSVPLFFGGSYRFRPIRSVIEEIERSDKKNVIFLDDNIAGDLDYATKLFTELKPLKKHWGAQCSITIARHPELLELASRAGCLALFIGFESISKNNLAGVKKGFNHPEEYAEAIKKIHSYGINIMAAFIFGFDHDDPSIFERTVSFLIENKVAIANFAILTPFPGTEVYKQFKKEGRILTYDWDLYTANQVVFRPKLMSPEELLFGFEWADKAFFNLPSIAKRFPANWRHPLFYFVLNFTYLDIRKRRPRPDETLLREVFNGAHKVIV
ncbi:MAG: B12-binding domain-containing radical SAM protein [Acidobacteria bacterium]|nr:B12-binding domain-containing radical SAM protein [Acidobacteriota bacterium]